ncbi:Plasmodium exported protein, unknown function [Plasmodium gonderi]|uniref:Uncharacterized protein n=1 Tax=Plasmodium gonderi TaxID=77519 RepID=A0A1Y1JKR9_PLAGO|nr:Plasmodium exported protein, unknown function [Plasmodium gonderi]GAW82045.1 Plasmodium exported protein, unknown function [Plasmodium gonderi]
MKNCDNVNRNTYESGNCAHSKNTFISSSVNDSKDTVKQKTNFLSITKICAFTILVWICQHYDNGNMSSSVCLRDNLKNAFGLKSERILSSKDSAEFEMINRNAGNEKQQGNKSGKSRNKNLKASSDDCENNEVYEQNLCASCKCSLKSVDSYFEKKLFDILDAGNKKAGELMESNAHIISGLMNYLKYVFLFSPVLLELLANTLLVSGHYKLSQFVSTVCVSFYLYVFYKIIQNCTAEVENIVNSNVIPCKTGSCKDYCDKSCQNTCNLSGCNGEEEEETKISS